MAPKLSYSCIMITIVSKAPPLATYNNHVPAQTVKTGVSLITGLLITGLDWNGLDWNLKIRFYALRYAITTKSLPGMFILTFSKNAVMYRHPTVLYL